MKKELLNKLAKDFLIENDYELANQSFHGVAYGTIKKGGRSVTGYHSGSLTDYAISDWITSGYASTPDFNVVLTFMSYLIKKDKSDLALVVARKKTPRRSKMDYNSDEVDSKMNKIIDVFSVEDEHLLSLSTPGFLNSANNSWGYILKKLKSENAKIELLGKITEAQTFSLLSKQVELFKLLKEENPELVEKFRDKFDKISNDSEENDFFVIKDNDYKWFTATIDLRKLLSKSVKEKVDMDAWDVSRLMQAIIGKLQKNHSMLGINNESCNSKNDELVVSFWYNGDSKELVNNLFEKIFSQIIELKNVGKTDKFEAKIAELLYETKAEIMTRKVEQVANPSHPVKKNKL